MTDDNAPAPGGRLHERLRLAAKDQRSCNPVLASLCDSAADMVLAAIKRCDEQDQEIARLRLLVDANDEESELLEQIEAEREWAQTQTISKLTLENAGLRGELGYLQAEIKRLNARRQT